MNKKQQKISKRIDIKPREDLIMLRNKSYTHYSVSRSASSQEKSQFLYSENKMKLILFSKTSLRTRLATLVLPIIS